MVFWLQFMGVNMIEEIKDKQSKAYISCSVLEALTGWFEIKESREQYIKDCEEQIFIAAKEAGKEIGFLCLKETGKDTVEVAVMGVLKEYHRHGTGKELVKAAKNIAIEKGYSFLQVKTVQMGFYENYDRTNLFYRNAGFKEFEVFPMLWDENNPCQVYVMALK